MWKFCKIRSFCGPKFCRNFAFLQNFHTKKLGEIRVFCAVLDNPVLTLHSWGSCSSIVLSYFFSDLEKYNLNKLMTTWTTYFLDRLICYLHPVPTPFYHKHKSNHHNFPNNCYHHHKQLQRLCCDDSRLNMKKVIE